MSKRERSAEQHTQRRDGTQYIGTVPAGSRIYPAHQGGLLVIPPNEPPYVLQLDGSRSAPSEQDQPSLE